MHTRGMYLCLGASLLVALGCDNKAATPKTPSATAATKTGAATKAEPDAKAAKELVIYCGRNEQMLKPILAKFEKDKGITLKVQYGKSAELAATLMEEGDKSPADVFFAQDVSTLGFLEKEGRLVALPDTILNRVPATFRSANNFWVGTSGRARVLAYSTKNVQADALPAGVDALVDERFKGKLGWAPENASFQSFVAAMIALRGPDKTKAWLQGIQKLEPKAYPSNTPMVQAIGRGEIDYGLTNHYYLFRLKAEKGDDFAVANHYFRNKKAGSLVNAAGLGIVKTSKRAELAQQFIDWVLSAETQTYFATKTHEFPLAAGVKASDKLPPIKDLATPEVDLSKLGDLKPTVELLREAGVLK